MRFDVPELMLKEIQSVMDVQLNDPSTKTDSYMRGMANGMILIDSIIRGIEPKYIEKPTADTEDSKIEKIDLPGMSLRDYFAAKAMQGFVQNIKAYDDSLRKWTADHSYKIADAMLESRKSQPKQS